MDVKEFFKQLLSRKFAVALVGILALCYIASISGGQVTVDEKSVISVVPMPKVPAAAQKIDWLKLVAMAAITVITCLTVCIQGKLDHLKMSKNDPDLLHKPDWPRPEESAKSEKESKD